MLDKKLMMRISVFFCIFVAFWGVAFASYTIWSNNVAAHVSSQASLSLTVNGGLQEITIPYGGTVTLTAHLSDDANGILVHFWNVTGNAEIGTGYTQDGGTAIYTTQPLSTGDFQFNATCDHP